ncbi:DUF6957 family protein [Pseudomonas monteilii]|uniref:DUF6957 family protein n=1 Tax=Pseudomonas monteilii TaxID=76759 RepID=UPI001FD05C58|nr:hypothetical protein [Pseudomonas monteilii]MCJ7853086.1 hypothetical protein [Pseudomonas monteilii]
MRFFKPKALTELEKEITASLKALKTLSCVDGRLSVEPTEVVDRPGYEAARTAAASLTHKVNDSAGRRWSQLSDEDLTELIASQILQARAAGLSVDDALRSLRTNLVGDEGEPCAPQTIATTEHSVVGPNDEKGGTVEAAQLAYFLLDGAEHVKGLEFSDDQLIDIARSRSGGKPFCVIRNWILLDVMVSDKDERALEAQGLRPTVMLGRQIVFDSRTQSSRSGGLRSSFMFALVDSVFESKDTLYFLAGPGLRKHTSLTAVLTLDNVGWRVSKDAT